jgi:hypothetical protein
MQKQQARYKTNHLNLLKMTAIISSTKTVMMAMVITRFVAILESCQHGLTVPCGDEV